MSGTVTITQKHLMIGGGLLLVAGLAYLWGRGAGGVAQDASRAVVNVAGGAATGVVHGVSDVIGMPVPERAACDAAKAEGRTWDASFMCPAGEFVSYVFSPRS